MGRVLCTVFLACSLIMGIPVGAKPSDREAAESSVTQGYQSIPERKFLELFQEYICQRLAKQKSDVVISNFKVLSNRPVPSGKTTINLFQKNNGKLEGPVRLMALVSINGIVTNKIRLSGWVDIFESVLCASRRIKRGETLREEDVHLARKNTSHLSPNVLTDTAQALGLRAKHTIEGNTCLKKWMLEKSPIVERGDMVTIVAKSGDLKVTAPGRVLEKGYLGEPVRVQNSMSQRHILARVINNSTVIVDF